MTNLWKIVTFVVENVTLERELVPEVEDFNSQISTKCPVGRGLVTARQGNSFTAEAPGGDVEVKVLKIADK